ncbi:MAG TPA: hypothetical protein VHR45_05680 [Thermoanaerobaculia bacterium]|nr:hypothetical protein [Thermoanaerobaculia bacterium]
MARHERPYILDPFDGYALSVDPGRRDLIERAYRGLLDSGSVVPARQAAGELLAVDPKFYPAAVLASQVDLVEGDNQSVVVRLLPIGDAMPSYTASQLLLGRAAELAGDLPLAYAAFRAVAARNGKAFERTGELHPRALEIVGRRVQDEVRAGRLEQAERDLGLLSAWGPSEVATIEGARALAVARHDLRGELNAVKGLSGRRPADRELLERRAELELEVGDPSAGLKILQDLADRNRDDRGLAEKLAAAKFRWRLAVLPADVREMAAKPELSRADLSVLLVWLVPEVRYAKPTEGRIATDILDHPHRDEIAHVINLGLLDVDPNLHRFSPAAPVRRGAALRSLARLLASFGRRVACLEQAGAQAGSCDIAVECGLVADQEACDPGDALSGPDAVEMIRHSLVLLGGA